VLTEIESFRALARYAPQAASRLPAALDQIDLDQRKGPHPSSPASLMTRPSRPASDSSFQPMRQAITQSDHLPAATNSDRQLGAVGEDRCQMAEPGTNNPLLDGVGVF
jgi:hypothetical protein